MGGQLFDGLGGGIFALRRPRPYRRTYAPIARRRFSIAARAFVSSWRALGGAYLPFWGTAVSNRTPPFPKTVATRRARIPFPAEPPPYGFEGVAPPPTTVKGGLLASAPGFANTTGRVL